MAELTMLSDGSPILPTDQLIVLRANANQLLATTMAQLETLPGFQAVSAVSFAAALARISALESGHVTASLIADSDVLITSPAAGDLLAYNATLGKWVNVAASTVSGGGSGATGGTGSGGASGGIALGSGAFLPARSSQTSTLVFSNANTTATCSGGSYVSASSNVINSTGKRYAEFIVSAPGGNDIVAFGVANAPVPDGQVPGSGGLTTSAGWASSGAAFRTSGLQVISALGGDPVTGTVYGIAVDYLNHDMWLIGPSGIWNGITAASPIPASGGGAGPGGMNSAAIFNGAITSLLSGPSYLAASMYNTSSVTLNIGQSPWVYTIPAGYEAWGQT